MTKFAPFLCIISLLLLSSPLQLAGCFALCKKTPQQKLEAAQKKKRALVARTLLLDTDAIKLRSLLADKKVVIDLNFVCDGKLLDAPQLPMRNNITPLAIAVSKKSFLDEELTELLLEHKAIPDPWLCNLMVIAGKEMIITRFLSHKAMDPNAVLAYAADQQNKRMIDLLIKGGGNPAIAAQAYRSIIEQNQEKNDQLRQQAELWERQPAGANEQKRDSLEDAVW